MPNRAERRKAQKAQEQQNRINQKNAAAQFERDMKRDGDFDSATALKDPFYMEHVVTQRKKQREGWDRNGITKEDLDREYDRGYKAAQKALTDYFTKFFFAAVAIALKREFKFGCGRIRRVMASMYQIMTWEITTCDILERCKDETGIEVNLTEMREEIDI